MHDAPTLMLVGLAGALLGGVYFGGLWWTVHKGISSGRPALWFSVSLVARMSVILAGFHVVSRGHWEALLSCLVGFFMARVAVIWLTRTTSEARRAPQP